MQTGLARLITAKYLFFRLHEALRTATVHNYSSYFWPLLSDFVAEYGGLFVSMLYPSSSLSLLEEMNKNIKYTCFVSSMRE